MKQSSVIVPARTGVPFRPDYVGRGSSEFDALVAHLLGAKGDIPEAAARAAADDTTPRRVQSVLKSAVAAGSLADPNWAGNLADYRLIVEGFVESLRSASAFDRMLGDGAFRVLPLRTRTIVVTAGATGAIAQEGTPKRLSEMRLSGAQLEPRKAYAIVAVSHELARAGGDAALALIGRELRNAVGTVTDAEFIAGVTAGSAIFTAPSSGNDADHVIRDLADLLANIATGSGSRLYAITTAAITKKLAVMPSNVGSLSFPGMTPAGGTIGGIPVLASDGVPAGTLVMVDAAQIAAGTGTVTLDEATQAAIQLDDAPADGPAPLTSLWQLNLAAIKAERYFGFERLNDAAVAVLTGLI